MPKKKFSVHFSQRNYNKIIKMKDRHGYPSLSKLFTDAMTEFMMNKWGVKLDSNGVFRNQAINKGVLISMWRDIDNKWLSIHDITIHFAIDHKNRRKDIWKMLRDMNIRGIIEIDHEKRSQNAKSGSKMIRNTTIYRVNINHPETKLFFAKRAILQKERDFMGRVLIKDIEIQPSKMKTRNQDFILAKKLISWGFIDREIEDRDGEEWWVLKYNKIEFMVPYIKDEDISIKNINEV